MEQTDKPATNTILVIEDNMDLRSLLSLVLDRMGFKAVAFSNGRDAIEYLKTNAAPKAAIIDLFMPVMGGTECLTALRDNPDFANVPVILSSGVNDIEQRAQELGVQGFLKKPLSVAAIQTVLRNLSVH